MSELKSPAWRDIAILAKGGTCVALVAAGLSLIFPSSKDLPGGVRILSDALGYAYTACWSYSFYPQVFLNRKRRSVAGLSIDYQMMNLLGFACYSVYNCALFFSSKIQHEYIAAYSDNIPVSMTDVVFSVHALFITAVTLVQCAVYDRGEQVFGSRVGYSCLGVTFLAVLATVVVTFFGAPGSWLSWIYLLIALSVIKLFISLIKYIPQVLMNQRSQSTQGWNIWNVLLDFSGGFLSLAQLLLDSAVTNDWQQVAGNPVKFALGLFSMAFDIVFMVQHYILYNDNSGYLAGVLEDSVSNEGVSISDMYSHSDLENGCAPTKSCMDCIKPGLDTID